MQIATRQPTGLGTALLSAAAFGTSGAFATALIGSSAKTAYNDDDPSTDATRKYVPEIQNDLTALTNALADDFSGLGFQLCAKGV